MESLKKGETKNMIVLVGGSCTGKSTIAKKLVEFGYEQLVTYTTRPPRKGEVNGVDYHFITDEQFEMSKEQGFFCETTEYEISVGVIWKYGTAKSDLSDNKVCVLNPEGLKTLKKDKSLDVTTFLFLASNETIWNRLRQRQDSSDSAHRRIEADRKDFEGINEYIDFTIRTDTSLNEDQVAELVDYIYKKSY